MLFHCGSQQRSCLPCALKMCMVWEGMIFWLWCKFGANFWELIYEYILTHKSGEKKGFYSLVVATTKRLRLSRGNSRVIFSTHSGRFVIFGRFVTTFSPTRWDCSGVHSAFAQVRCKRANIGFHTGQLDIQGEVCTAWFTYQNNLGSPFLMSLVFKTNQEQYTTHPQMIGPDINKRKTLGWKGFFIWFVTLFILDPFGPSGFLTKRRQ